MHKSAITTEDKPNLQPENNNDINNDQVTTRTSRTSQLTRSGQSTKDYEPIDEILRLRFQLEEVKQQRDQLLDASNKWVLVQKGIANLYVSNSFCFFIYLNY